MTRGGERAGSGRKPRGDVTMSEMLRAPVTPSMLWWARHAAEHAGLTLAEWLRFLVDRSIGEHACEECADERPRKLAGAVVASKTTEAA